MPFVDFVSKEDRVSLWYCTNTPSGNTGSFDPAKPCIVMLHPLFLDSSWLVTQMEDPRLSTRYNIVAFDFRSCGMSNSRPSAAHDTWVDAADIAFAHQALGLPSSHFFAVENISVNAALRIAALFPEICSSLTLVNVPPPTELEWVFDTYGELLQLWCHPQDLDEFDHALEELSQCMLGKDCSTELQERLVTFWTLTYPPWRRTRVYELMHCVLNRNPLPETVLAAITQPTLIIQADKTDINPIEYADQLVKDLVNVEGRARVHTIKGSPEYVTIIPSCASIVNRVFAEFLSRQTRSQLPTTIKMKSSSERAERIHQALQTLASLLGDETIATRDPTSALSFSCVSKEVLQSETELLNLQMKDELTAFSPLGLDGRLLRSFMERSNGHWFQADKDTGYSVATNHSKEEKLVALENLVTQTELRSSSNTKDGVLDHISASKPVTSEVARSGRLRRSTISKHVVEKATIGGSNGSFAPTLIQNTLQMSRLRY